MPIDYSVKPSGPLFDGRIARAVRPFLDTAAKDVAQHGADIVWLRGRGTFKTWTGNWGDHIVVERRHDGYAVTDGGIIYGPWLEGTGSRNRTSRFKGYRTFRKAQQELDAKTATIVEASLKRSTLGKLLGGG